jgi:hypothetical protein
LKKKYEENNHYQYILTNQTEHDKILRKILKTNENIKYNEELIGDYLNEYKSKENIIRPEVLQDNEIKHTTH